MVTKVTVTDYMIGYLEGGISDDTCAFLKGSETSSEVFQLRAGTLLPFGQLFQS